jgi:hypothetical protein
MRPIEVFYHVFIPADNRYTLWTWWIDQQLQLIAQSRLSDIARTVNMSISMPRHYGEISPGTRIPFRINRNKESAIHFEHKIQEYIHTRYPFVQIIDIRDSGQPNIFEGQMLNLLWNKCQNDDFDLLYLHTKGVVSASPQVACWREILNHYCVTEWAKCVKMLNDCDVVGVKDLHSDKNNTISGNFWWTHSNYVKSLPDPLLCDTYNRYSYEHWIKLSAPDTKFIIDTQTDHHDDYCFLENLLKQNI